MSNFHSLKESKVAIWGLGLMGGSLALALQGKCASLIGIDPDQATLELARQMKLVDSLAENPIDMIQDADLIILAAPVKGILQQLQALPNLHSGNAVILDLGSTKQDIVHQMSFLPDNFDPIGGHPMCGKEKSSLASAEAGLFVDSRFALVTLERTSSHAKSLAVELVNTIHAIPLWLDAAVHDQWTASTSHLPYLIANAISSTTPFETSPLIGPGFRSMTRISVEPVDMMMDILITNRANILTTLSQFMCELKVLEDFLEQKKFPELRQQLENGKKHQLDLLAKSLEEAS